jgi:hypothetical protein
MGVAAERTPLATGPDPLLEGDPRRRGTGGPGSGGEMRDMENARPRFMEGTACRPDAAAIAVTLGPLSPATAAAIEKLPPREKVAVLLASPEALRR